MLISGAANQHCANAFPRRQIGLLLVLVRPSRRALANTSCDGDVVIPAALRMGSRHFGGAAKSRLSPHVSLVFSRNARACCGYGAGFPFGETGKVFPGMFCGEIGIA